MKLAMQVGPGHIVLDRDPVPKKGTATPNFRAMSVVTKWLDGLRWITINTYVKNYRNRIMCVNIIASQRWDVFLRHSVEKTVFC